VAAGVATVNHGFVNIFAAAEDDEIVGCGCGKKSYQCKCERKCK
jgi:hypothetical protein